MYYQMPRGVGVKFGPMSTARGKEIPLGFLETRDPGSRNGVKNIFPYQMSPVKYLVLDYSGMLVPGCGVPNYVGVCSQ